jgi:hypothetical protein
VSTAFDASTVLNGLYDFQRATVEHAFRRLYEDHDSTRRFLVADETGLGKTHIARGVIAKTIERLQHDVTVKRIDVVYVCSNTNIAEQNLRKLDVTGNYRASPATRLTLLVTQRELLRSTAPDGGKPLTFVAFTPATSFEFGWQTGKAQERAVLFELLASHLDLDRASRTAFKRMLQGSVSTLDRFQLYLDHLRYRTDGEWEPEIQRAFLDAFNTAPGLRAMTEDLIDGVRYRSALSRDQTAQCRELTALLRHTLARASVSALEPDLVVLDEFQRFRNLLGGESQAGELAGHLFDQPEARVLLLSATPYKSFTFAEEAAEGEDHYADLVRTLEFLDNKAGTIGAVRESLRDLRRITLAGEPMTAAKGILETGLRRLMSRTERPPLGEDGMLGQVPVTLQGVQPEDLTGYVALHRMADELKAPMTVDYWKSAPYFGNFLDGYKVGEKLKQAMKDADRRAELMPMVRALHTFRRRGVERFEPIEWGNARLRHLASETVEAGWWQLLWVPPSMPYHEPGGPYADPSAQRMTKRLVFSSWVAAPTAIASLLSYDADRHIYTGVDREHLNTPEGRRSIATRLSFRMDGDRPGSMSIFALFWPSPALADATDPLAAARETPGQLLDENQLVTWARSQAQSIVGDAGQARGTATAAWHWAAPILAERGNRLVEQLVELGSSALSDALLGSAEEADGDTEGSDVVDAHVALALQALQGHEPEVDRPEDLLDSTALLGLAAPGNVAWRALARLRPQSHATTDAGLWRAAALLASGVRNLFNRPEVTLLLDQLDPDTERPYWRKVAEYCLHGNLQAVLDEYLHHLAEADGLDASTDDGLLQLAQAARRALTLRSARYVAFDPERPERDGIPFLSRFALRFGNVRQDQDDVRLPEVRAAFNSPFWPFVLATTSIGQEGVDFHWWCHALVHWNLPSSPVDFEQREGRVNRFKGHAVRRNIATQYRIDALRADGDPWKRLFDAAVNDRRDGASDLEPYWIFAGPAAVERHILSYPLSRDQQRWAQLQDLLALYRLAFGQPRQEDMVSFLSRRGLVGDARRIAELRLDLRPPPLVELAEIPRQA